MQNNHSNYPVTAVQEVYSSKSAAEVRIRNCRFDAGDSFLVWPVTMAELDERNDQFYNAAEAIVTGDGSYRIYAQALADFGESTRMTDGYIYVNQDTSVSFDIRISLYEGNYDGDYIPYV